MIYLFMILDLLMIQFALVLHFNLIINNYYYYFPSIIVINYWLLINHL